MNSFDVSRYVKLGIAPAILFPAALNDEYAHFNAIDFCCRTKEFEAIEACLPSDPVLRKKELALLKEFRKTLHYNFPGDFQLDGIYNSGSDNPEYRKNALELMKRNIEYAAEADSKLIVMTSCPDQGEAKRDDILKRFKEFFTATCIYAEQFGIKVSIEPIERGVFKNLVLGPTNVCADFIKEMHSEGYLNCGLTMDTAHLPTMSEDFEPTFDLCSDAGLLHIHLGNAVISDAKHPYYGHMHPPIGIQGGEFDVWQMKNHLAYMIKQGYINLSADASNRAAISFETRPYPGVTPATSLNVIYEKFSEALVQAIQY